MVLDFQGVPNSLFSSSEASGEGLGASYTQKVIIEEGAGIVPIGGLVPWCKSFTGVPDLVEQNLFQIFVECDGSVLDDPDSPLNGQTLPNLNGRNQFPRGATTSGTTGGSTVSGNESAHTHAVGAHNHTGSVSGTTSEEDDTQEVEYGTGKTIADRNHTHTFSDSFTVSTDPAFDTDAGTAHHHVISPKFYNVVWLIRVK